MCIFLKIFVTTKNLAPDTHWHQAKLGGKIVDQVK